MSINLTKEQLAAEEAEKNEGKIKAEDLVAEIVPLITDYFTGRLNADGNRVEFKFLNGQKFLLTIKETF